jgi:hypothetical protein
MDDIDWSLRRSVILMPLVADQVGALPTGFESHFTRPDAVRLTDRGDASRWVPADVWIANPHLPMHPATCALLQKALTEAGNEDAETDDATVRESENDAQSETSTRKSPAHTLSALANSCNR